MTTPTVRPRRRAVLGAGLGLVGGLALWGTATPIVSVAPAERGRHRPGNKSANGWPVIATASAHRIEGSTATAATRDGDLATILLYVTWRFHYQPRVRPGWRGRLRSLCPEGDTGVHAAVRGRLGTEGGQAAQNAVVGGLSARTAARIPSVGVRAAVLRRGVCQARRKSSNRLPAATRAVCGLPGSSLGSSRVRCTLATKLVNEPVEAADEKRLNKTIARYGPVDLLCIDELDYREPDRRGAELLFQVLTERQEKNSVAKAFNEFFGG